MYTYNLPENCFATMLVKIKYDCCGKDHTLKWKDADKNFKKNNGKHICRPCWLRNNNPFARTDVKTKIKKTNLEKYGNTVAANAPDKVAARMERLWGNEETKQKIVEKRKKTSRERYGADHVMQTDEGMNRLKESMQERYGVDFPLQAKEVIGKMKKTCQERYSVDNVAKLEYNVLKAEQTMMERYGVKHYNELPEMRDYLREHCREWLKDSWENPWAKGIERPEEWNQKQSKTMADKIISGEFTPEDSRFYLTGHFISNKCKKHRAFFRSSMELKTHYLLHMDENVTWYENEPFSIEYVNKDGLIRRYIPDFFAMRKNASPWLLEIKPAFRMREIETQFKVTAAENFALENGFEFMYVDENYLGDVDLNAVVSLPFVEVINMKKT